MHYYYITKAQKENGDILAINTVVTNKDLRIFAQEKAIYPIPIQFKNKKEAERFMNKEVKFNVYIADSYHAGEIATSIVVTYKGHAAPNEDGISETEVKIRSFIRKSKAPGNEADAHRQRHLQAASILTWFLLKNGYTDVSVNSDVPFDIFAAVSPAGSGSLLNPTYEDWARHELQISATGLPEADIKFIRFMQQLRNVYPPIKQVAVSKLDTPFAVLAKGYACEETGEPLPEGYGEAVSFLG